MEISGTRSTIMFGGPPWRVFGRTIAACHGVPLFVTVTFVAVLLLLVGELASQSIKPTQLSAIWFEPNKITVAEIQAQTPGNGALHLHKTGIWRRLCASTSEQTFITERGGEVLKLAPHTVEVPSKTGPIRDKVRPVGIQVPKSLMTEFGKVRFRLELTSSCWWLENYFPIYGGRTEAVFEIVP
jgi:hypothetical protein